MSRGKRRDDWVTAALVGVVAGAVFLPAAGFPFLNWDDQDVFTRNDGLRASGVVAWAFGSRYMEHFQPLAWLTWAAVDRVAALTPSHAHLLNVILHALAAGLVTRLIGGLLKGSNGWRAAIPAALAALAWAIHPMRVEVVAWASAMPYTLAAVFAIAATIAWADARAWTAATLCAASFLSRPIAFALPVVLWMLRRPSSAGDRVALLAAGGAAAAAALVESSARLTASLSEFGVGPRLELAAAAPWRYLWLTIWPVELTPLHALASAPVTNARVVVAGGVGVAAVSLAAWRFRGRFPLLAGAWAAYLLLLAPAAGLMTSGLQAAADRYAYLPGIAASVALGDLLARAAAGVRSSVTAAAAGQPRARRRHWRRREMAAVVGAVTAAGAIAVMGVRTRAQTMYWSDSIALWTRAVEIDPGNDVALYNLAAALGEAGRRAEAIERYDQLLGIRPSHREAAANRNRLAAASLEEEANGLASSGQLAAAAERYASALRLDTGRTHSHAALGVALVELERYADARPHLQTAVERGVWDPAVANALAYVLVRSGERERAIDVLRAARDRHPSDPDVARNLALLEAGRR